MLKSRRNVALVAAIGVSVLLLPAGVFAATGGNLILGRSNRASSTTELLDTRAGSVALRLKTDRASTPNLAVSNSAKIARLNADKLDGVSVEALQRRSRMFSPGTYTVTVPAGVRRVVLRLWGGGGGGGGIGGSGGGEGGYLEVAGVVAPGDKLTIKVGGGGSPAPAGTYTSGAVGGTTRVTSPGWMAQALGGHGGSASSEICTAQGNAVGGSADSGAALALDGREGAPSEAWTCSQGGSAISHGGRTAFSEVGAGGNGSSANGVTSATPGMGGAALLEFA